MTIYATESLSIDIHPSKTLLHLLRFTHIGAAMIIGYLGASSTLSLWLALPLLVVCCYSYTKTIQLHALRSLPDAIVNLQCDAQGQWGITTRAGEYLPVSIENDTFLTRKVLILSLNTAQNSPISAFRKPRKYLTIVQDSINPELFRKLISHLKML